MLGRLAPVLPYRAASMWNRNEAEGENVPPEPGANAAAGKNRQATGGVASLGPSISIKGTLTGEEDLVIEGRLEGEVALHNQSVTIGRSGRVRADVHGSSICVEGEVHGNLFGEKQVIIRQSGKVRGNVTAPRVNLENGAKFKGAIDMQPGSVGSSGSASQAVKKKATGSQRATGRETPPPERRSAAQTSTA